jgi:hypothetical protein
MTSFKDRRDQSAYRCEVALDALFAERISDGLSPAIAARIAMDKARALAAEAKRWEHSDVSYGWSLDCGEYGEAHGYDSPETAQMAAQKWAEELHKLDAGDSIELDCEIVIFDHEREQTHHERTVTIFVDGPDPDEAGEGAYWNRVRGGAAQHAYGGARDD